MLIRRAQLAMQASNGGVIVPPLEELSSDGPCGLKRLIAVHREISNMGAPWVLKHGGFVHNEYLLRPDHVIHFRRALRAYRARNICEIGFNMGHGAALWLEGTDAVLYSFDLPVTGYAIAARNLSAALYPGRVHFHDGTSALTVPEFVKSIQAGLSPACDLWYVDGMHSGSLVLHDMRYAVKASHNGTLIIADDCTRHWNDVPTAWHRLNKEYTLLSNISPYWWRVLPTPTYVYTRHSHVSGWCAGLLLQTAPAGPSRDEGRAG